MKNLPATIGLIAILTLLIFFKGDPDHAVQAAPAQGSNTEVFGDMFSPGSLDTTMPRHHPMKESKKKEKGKDSTWRHKKDTIM